jgi:hypothetical protein
MPYRRTTTAPQATSWVPVNEQLPFSAAQVVQVVVVGGAPMR